MVTCRVNEVQKMSNSKKLSSASSGFRLLDGEQFDEVSSVSRNSIYKLKIDAMFDDSRSITSQQLDDNQGSQRVNTIVVYGRNKLPKPLKNHSSENLKNNDLTNTAEIIEENVQKMSNNVQAQIERMFTDVAKDATSSFDVKCLGSLALKDKVTSLQGLQAPLRQLYLSESGQNNNYAGSLDICPIGLRIKMADDRDPFIAPFYNIAVWSAVKFVISASDGGAAFLPLITDPENIDKSTLFQPLSFNEQRRFSSNIHAPIFTVVMRSNGTAKILECHAFICQSAEDAIVIAASLYQSLMAHVALNTQRSKKPRAPRNQNGVSCISIASSSSKTNLQSTKKLDRHLNSSRNSQYSSFKVPCVPLRPPRKKRTATSSLSGESDSVREIVETSTDERSKKSYKSKKAPPVPATKLENLNSENDKNKTTQNCLESKQRLKSFKDSVDLLSYEGVGGDILTRVAIPRSGSFLNTRGLTRYKSRATRRHIGKTGCGGGGSPLGFSELFNEFRLHENLHSLDDILNAIINADGMSFNNLKPIYKEFLLKLALTLTKDELFQRSKNIMRRQKKRRTRKKSYPVHKKRNRFIIGTMGLKKVFLFGTFRSCRANKSSKNHKTKYHRPKATSVKTFNRARIGTSGSDLSETRNENTLNAINRNSSSGYVSCSECSYDSEACTCTSADRCYCSLGADHDHVNQKLSKTQNRINKCYCTASEANPTSSSETNWCDSESCLSDNKCYCTRGPSTKKTNTKHKSKNKLALNYDFFTFGNGAGQSLKSNNKFISEKSTNNLADIKTDIQKLTTQKKRTNSKIRPTSNCSKRNNNIDNYNKKPDIKGKKTEFSNRGQRKTEKYSYQSIRAVSSVSLEDSLGYLP